MFGEEGGGFEFGGCGDVEFCVGVGGAEGEGQGVVV